MDRHLQTEEKSNFAQCNMLLYDRMLSIILTSLAETPIFLSMSLSLSFFFFPLHFVPIFLSFLKLLATLTLQILGLDMSFSNILVNGEDIVPLSGILFILPHVMLICGITLLFD